jgi:hypothetical protein
LAGGASRRLAKVFQSLRDAFTRHFGGSRISEFNQTRDHDNTFASNPNRRRGSEMKAYWVIDILKDIRQFSEKNGMLELAEQLDDAIFVAASEIGAQLCGAGTVDVAKGQARGALGAVADGELY